MEDLRQEFEAAREEFTGGCDRSWCERCEFETVCQGEEIVV